MWQKWISNQIWHGSPGRILEAKEDPEGCVRVVRLKDEILQEISLESIRGTWTSYYQNISNVLNRGFELEVKPEQILLQMKVFDAAMISIELGKFVPVGR